jgi:Kef-type K+ transport system membrane component KefB
VAIEHIFLNILIILATAKLFGELAKRAKQPALVGELSAGMILGPSLFFIIKPDDSNLELLSHIAVFFLMLLAGLEMDIRNLRKVGKASITISLIAFMIPFVSGTLVSQLFGLTTVQSLFMGLLFSITAIPVSAIVLMEFGILKTKIGSTIMTAAVINDSIALIALIVILQMAASENQAFDFGAFGLSVVQISLFLGSMGIITYFMNRSKGQLVQKASSFFSKLHSREATFSILLITTISTSVLAKYLGLHFIIGTFFTALLFGKWLLARKESSREITIVSGITFGFLAPLFFGFIGVQFNVQSLSNAIPLFVALLSIAVVAKIGGGFIGAKISGFSSNDSLAVGCLMNGRGMIELIIASIGYASGILDLTLFSIAIGIGFITTILAPITARPFVAKAKYNKDVLIPIEN